MIDSDRLTPFGRLIRGARLQRDLTIKDVARSTGISWRLLLCYETGIQNRKPGTYNAMVLAKFYGISLDELIAKMFEEEKAR